MNKTDLELIPQGVVSPYQLELIKPRGWNLLVAAGELGCWNLLVAAGELGCLPGTRDIFGDIRRASPHHVPGILGKFGGYTDKCYSTLPRET